MKKWQDSGYWVSKHYYWQSMVYYLYNAAKYRSLTFFSACNPSLSFGGMLDDSKTEAYNIIKDEYLPQTIVYDSSIDIQEQLSAIPMRFPLIVKPNMGYKGYAVRECNDLQELQIYLGQMDMSKEWLIQEYIDYTNEYSIMYYKSPITSEYGITSISDKKYPTIIGDGKSTVKELINSYQNAFVDKHYLNYKWKEKLNEILLSGEEMQLHHIGNYSRGSTFNSVMEENGDELSQAMHRVFKEQNEIYFCRLDIKANSMEDIRNGKFKIMEINGAKSEPLHIYDPQYRLIDRLKDVRQHWKLMTRIVDERLSIGYQFPGNIQGLKSVKAVKRAVK